MGWAYAWTLFVVVLLIVVWRRTRGRTERFSGGLHESFSRESNAVTIQYRKNTANGDVALCTPHPYGNQYVVSKTRFKKDYVYVDSLLDVVAYLDMGYKVRVSDEASRSSPSLVCKASLVILTVRH